MISVPSGNFGNICAGLLANASGLPVQHFIAACNANDVIPKFLETNIFENKKSVATISNAMDVANPSNFVRIMEIFAKEMPALKEKLSSYSISDSETKATIKKVYEANNYLLDPHGAVGYVALEKYLANHPNQKGMVLETAHPVKFYDVVQPVIESEVSIPEAIKVQLVLEKKSTIIENDVENLNEFLNSL